MSNKNKSKNKKKVVIYHGLGGEPYSHYDNILKSKNYRVISDFHDYYQEWDTDNMESFFRNQLEIYNKKIDLVVGISFGAYVAYKIAKAKNIPCILIIPALDREKTRTRIKEVFVSDIKHDVPIEAYIAEDDELIPCDITLDWLNKHEPKAKIFLTNTGLGHAVSGRLFEAIIANSKLI